MYLYDAYYHKTSYIFIEWFPILLVSGFYYSTEHDARLYKDLMKNNVSFIFKWFMTSRKNALSTTGKCWGPEGWVSGSFPEFFSGSLKKT